jgi:hypothetical protein
MSSYLDEILGADPFADDPRPPAGEKMTDEQRYQQLVEATQEADYLYTGE